MEIVRKSACKFIGLLVHTRPDRRWIDMPKAWKEFFARCDLIPRRLGEAFVDVTFGRSGDVNDELVCCEVSETDGVLDGMVAIEIPAQTYLHHRHTGPPHAVAKAHGDAIVWARANGCALDGLELDCGYAKDGSETAHDLYFKIV